MKTHHRFWNRIAKKYATQSVADPAAYEHKLEKTREILNLEMNVLEIGCGTGTTALKHAPYVKQIIATDFSEGMINIAIEKASNQTTGNIDFKCEPAEDLKHHTQQYDVIMAHNFLHLLEQPGVLLEDIHNQLKPGGYLVAGTACINDVMKWFRFIAPVAIAIKAIPYVNCFTKQELLEWIHAAGFTIEYNWQPSKKSSLFTILRKAD